MTLTRAISGLTAAALVLVTAVTGAGAASAAPAATSTGLEITAKVDPETNHEYPGTTDSEVYFASTGHAGRVWTDKTVLTDEIGVPDDGTGTGEPRDLAHDELAVSLSALGSTRHMVSTIPTPIDVVLILDVSGSMGYCIGTEGGTPSTSICSTLANSRAQAMANAVNTAIDIIVEDNPANRVSLVSFAEKATPLRGLSTPKTFTGSSEYVRVKQETLDSGSKRFYLEYVNDSNKTGSVNFAGGTNTQKGVHVGMNQLASVARSTVTGTNQRLPNVVLLTDGEPTRSATGSWWAPEEAMQGTGNISRDHWGNGFKAAMSAAFMKNKIADVYGHASNKIPFTPKVYTVGLGINGLSDIGRDHSRVTLDPKTYYGHIAPDNVFITGFNTAFEDYLDGKAPKVRVNESQDYIVQHPTSDADKKYDVTDLRYNDAYYAPMTPQDLKDVFTEIARQIVAPVANPPVHTAPGSESASGYVTFTDPLGDFMEVTDMNRLTFCSFDKKRVEDDLTACNSVAYFDPQLVSSTRTDTGRIDKYEFGWGDDDKPYKANDLYPSTHVSTAVITVERNDDPAVGDIVTWKIPSALLPMRDSYIVQNDQGKLLDMSVEVSHPVHLYYVVSPKTVDDPEAGPSSVLEYLDNPFALDEVFPGAGGSLVRYVRENKTPDGGVRFYANDFETTTAGRQSRADASFLPAEGNLFYRFGTDTVLYSDADATEPISEADWAGFDPQDTVYYRYDSYWQTGNAVEPVEKQSVILDTTRALLDLPAQTEREDGVPGLEVVANGDGLMTAPKSMRDYARAANIDHLKCEGLTWDANGVPTCGETTANMTETDPSVRKTTYQGLSVVVNLGNNGYLETPVPGSLTIAKTVAHDRMTPDPETEFPFVVEFGGTAEDTTDYAYSVHQESELTTALRTGTVRSGGEIKLKDGELAWVVGLPDGATYTVTETSLPAGYTTPTTTAGGDIALPQEVPASVVFTNTYVAEPVTAAPAVAKVLERGEWGVDDTYTFNLCGSQLSTSCVTRTLTHADAVPPSDPGGPTTASAEFAPIEFTRPGTYEYTLTEKDENADNPSISYSAASYQWTVTVTDAGVGQLVAEAELTRVLDDAGQSSPSQMETATFTNFFSVDEVTGTLQATKLATDSTRTGGDVKGNPALAHEFTYRYLGASPDLPAGFDHAGHLLDGANEEVKLNKEKNSAVSSSLLTFTRAHVGHTYYYSVEEVVPDHASFVKTDDSVYVYAITVGLDEGTDVDDGSGGTKHPVTAQSTRCKTTQAAVTETNPFGGCVPGTGTFDQTAAEFVNKYDADPGMINLDATKQLEGRPWLDGDVFTFQIEGADAATRDAIAGGAVTLAGDLVAGDGILTVAATRLNATEGSVRFSLGFTKQGTYRFRVSEVAGTHGGMNYAPNSALYTVTVTNPANDEGTVLDVAGGLDTGSSSVFVNKYDPTEARAVPVFFKTLVGRSWLPSDEFEFVVTPGDGAPSPAATSVRVAQASAAGFDFGTIVFDKVGTYSYTVREQIPSEPAPGISYDQDPVTVKITVEDDYDGALRIASVRYEGAEHKEARQFLNTYSTSLDWQFDITKVLTGRELAADEFTFDMVPDEATGERFGEQAWKSVTNGEDSSGSGARMDGPAVTFTQDDAGQRYCWAVSENIPDVTLQGVEYDPETYTVCVDVTDDPQGAVLTASTTVVGSTGGDEAEPVVVTSRDENPAWPTVTFTNVYRPTLWTLGKSSEPGNGQVDPGSEIRYTLTVTDTGGEDTLPPTDVVVTDDLSGVLDAGWAEFVGFDDDTADAVFDPETKAITWEVGTFEGSATLSYTVRVDDAAYGVTMRNVATGTGNVPPQECVAGTEPDDLDETCATVHTTAPAWTISKEATPQSEEVVAPGSTVEYVLTVTNTSGELAVTDVVITDDLAGVQADGAATLVLDEHGELPAPPQGEVRLEGDTLVWDLGTLEVGEPIEYRYSVSVLESPLAYDATLFNVAWGTARGPDTDDDGDPDDLPPLQCTQNEPCSTNHRVGTPTWTLEKSSDSAEATPGGTLTYELTVTNTGDVPLWGARIVDGPVEHEEGVTDVWDLLAQGGAWDGAYEVTIAGLTQGYEDPEPQDGLQHTVGELAPGQQAVVRFTVRLPEKLDPVHLRNTVTGSLIPDPAGPGEPDTLGFAPDTCASPMGWEPCSVDHVYDPAPTPHADPGPTPDPDPGSTTSDPDPASTTQAYPASATKSPVVRTVAGGALAGAGPKAAALAGALALLVTAGALLVRRRRGGDPTH